MDPEELEELIQAETKSSMKIDQLEIHPEILSIHDPSSIIIMEKVMSSKGDLHTGGIAIRRMLGVLAGADLVH